MNVEIDEENNIIKIRMEDDGVIEFCAEDLEEGQMVGMNTTYLDISVNDIQQFLNQIGYKRVLH